MLIELVDVTHRRLLTLLQSALWNKPPDGGLFVAMEEDDWQKLFCAAASHGVIALALDGIMRAPENLTLPRKLKITWAANVDAIERRYDYKTAVAEELAVLLGKETVPVMLFKGMALAAYYPIPRHREFGDLDIYLFGKEQEAAQCLVKHGAKKEKYQNKKHINLSYKGVPVELHCFFLGAYHLKKVRRLENRLLKSLQQDLPPHQIRMGQLLHPPANFHALFLICHTLRHFTQGINFHALCDWAVFLHANKGLIAVEAYRSALAEAGWLKIADAFTALTVTLIGPESEVAPDCQRDRDLEEKILTDILNPVLMPKQPSFRGKIKYYYRRLVSERWKNELIYPRQYGHRIISSLFFHLRHPRYTFAKLFNIK